MPGRNGGRAEAATLHASLLTVTAPRWTAYGRNRIHAGWQRSRTSARVESEAVACGSPDRTGFHTQPGVPACREGQRRHGKGERRGLSGETGAPPSTRRGTSPATAPTRDE